jgi:predicted ATPase/class 3 adenylate cyclase
VATLVESLSSYVPTLITRRLTADPAPITQPTDERFSAAVLFADISGFGRLTERLTRRGPAGVEELSRLLNSYFGQLIDLFLAHGGDIVKFAGDGLLAIWTPTHKDAETSGPADPGQVLADLTLRAAQCGLTVQDTLHDYEIARGEKLSLRVTVGAGAVAAIYVGGQLERWEFMLAGSPLAQVGRSQKNTRPGEVVLSPEAWWWIRQQGTGVTLPTSDVRLLTLSDAPLPQATDAISLPPEAEAALWAYVPGAIRARLKAGQAGWLAELRRITVLFINLPDVDFTIPLSQAQATMQALQTALYRYEGSINKINVDDKGVTLVAALGLPPLAHVDDAIRGVQTALAMRTELHQIGVRSAIGVSTGRAFCGTIGNVRRRQYALHGDTVNLAARLMQAAGKDLSENALPGFRDLTDTQGPILCSAATYQAARASVEFGPPLPISVKGKTDPVTVYRPLGERQADQPPKSTTFISRAPERTTLTDQLQALLSGTGGVVIIEGEAGIGKSRLVEILIQQARLSDVTMLRGVGDAIASATPYYAWRPVFAALLGLNQHRAGQSEIGDKNPDQRRAQVHAHLEQVVPELLGLAPLLGPVLALEWPENELTAQLAGEVRADNTRALLVRLLQSAAESAPLLIILEDAHWLDSASWALAWQVNRDIQASLLVIAARPLRDRLPEGYLHLRDAPDTRTLKLEPLSPAETQALVCQCLGVDHVPEPVMEFVREKAEGHPFFTEELVYALQDTGLIQVANGEFQDSLGSESWRTLGFPDTIQALITSRIDRLAPQHQLALKVASVIGRDFSLRLLTAVYPIETDRPYLREYVNELARSDLVLLTRDEPDPAYSFENSITQETAYNLMAFSQRQRLHRAIAEWYEGVHVDDLPAFYTALAHHYRLAEAGSKAMHYLEKVGEQALRSGAYHEAVQLFGEALDLGQENGRHGEAGAILPYRQARLERLLGDAHWNAGDLAQSLSHAQQALKLLGRIEPTTEAGLVWSAFKQVLVQVLHRLLPTLFLGRAKDDTRLLEIAQAYRRPQQVYYFRNQLLPAFNAGIHHLNLTERVDPGSALLAESYASLCIGTGMLGLHPLAAAYARRAHKVAQTADSPLAMATVLQRVSMYTVGVAQWERTKTALQQASEIAKRIGDWRLLGDGWVSLGNAFYYEGDFDSMAKVGAELCALAERHDNPQQRIWGLNLQGMYHMQAGSIEQAIHYLQEAWKHLPQSNDRATEILNRGVVATAYLRQGKHQLALQATETVRNLIGRSRPLLPFTFDGYVAVAQVYLALWEASRGATTPSSSATDLHPATLHSETRSACRALHRYARTFPIGRPRAWLYRGTCAWLSGRPRYALRAWRRSLTEAKRLAMVYEQGLAHYEIGRHLPTDEPARGRHLDRAAEIFARLGAAYDRGRVDEARHVQ